MTKAPPLTLEEKKRLEVLWRQAARARPPLEADWADFLVLLRISKLERDERGGDLTEYDVRLPLAALLGLLNRYERPLVEYLKPIVSAIEASLAGQPHPLFKQATKKDGRKMSIDRQMIMGICARAQTELRLAIGNAKEAADEVAKAARHGGLPETGDITSATVLAWHRKLRNGNQRQPLAQLRYKQLVPGDTPKERAEELLNFLRHEK